MKNFFLYLSLAIVCTFSSCKNEEVQKPKVIYENTSKSKTEVATDSSQIKIADLPINMEGTNYLIYPVGNLNYNKNKSKTSINYEEDISYSVSNYGEFEITGFLDNLKFQEIGKDTIYSLTEKPILIQSATYLKDHAATTKQQFLVYVIQDMDTNKDGKLDNNDIKSLYLSTIDGKNFKKLTADFQELIDWKYIAPKKSIYFRSIEDSNKNGKFDSKDQLYYYFVPLYSKEQKAVTIIL